MGAHNIEFDMPGAPSFSAIKKQFEAERADNKMLNGHQEGYSGDFQTVQEVKDHTHKTFDSYDEAHRYCLDTAKKWDFVVAVRYRFIDKSGFKYSAKFNKLQTKVVELVAQLRVLEATPVKLRLFETCEGCRSKVATVHIHGTMCPVCNEGDFRPLGLQRKLAKMRTKIELLNKQSLVLKKSEKEKGMKKFGKVGTLVAGWGAS